MKLRLKPSTNERISDELDAVELSDGSEIPGLNAEEFMRRSDGTVFRADMATLALLEAILLELRALRQNGDGGAASASIPADGG